MKLISFHFFILTLMSLSISNSICASREINLEVENQIYRHPINLCGVITYKTEEEGEEKYEIPLMPVTPKSGIIAGNIIINVPRKKFKNIKLILFNGERDLKNATILAEGDYTFRYNNISELKAIIDYTNSLMRSTTITIIPTLNLPPRLFPAPSQQTNLD